MRITFYMKRPRAGYGARGVLFFFIAHDDRIYIYKEVDVVLN